MTGRRVVAICNLKPAKMRGLFSHAMIFAASSELKPSPPSFTDNSFTGEDDKVVELVTPPAGAKVGERVTVEGFAQPPLEAQLSGKVCQCQ
jgi:tRNA-binding EMAP/Myf-like protein